MIVVGSIINQVVILNTNHLLALPGSASKLPMSSIIEVVIKGTDPDESLKHIKRLAYDLNHSIRLNLDWFTIFKPPH